MPLYLTVVSDLTCHDGAATRPGPGFAGVYRAITGQREPKAPVDQFASRQP